MCNFLISLVKFIPRYSILLDVAVSETVFLIFFYKLFIAGV